uniref:Homeobox domain-containing protein n=1 Tax=Syphacia muris TaxID=451379 RepID=A0A0N5AQ11_9BILA
MYPSWHSPEESSPATAAAAAASVQPYWSQHVNQATATAVAHQKVAVAAYEPLLYQQNYMKNMLGAAAQWVESSSTFTNYNAIQPPSTSHLPVLPTDRTVQINQPVFPWMKMTG